MQTVDSFKVIPENYETMSQSVDGDTRNTNIRRTMNEYGDLDSELDENDVMLQRMILMNFMAR